jgi:uncharacterized protein (DUF2249 family)
VLKIADFLKMLNEGKSLSDIFIWASGHDPKKVFKRLERMVPVEYEYRLLETLI